MPRRLAVFVLTVSDRCAAAAAEDRSGPAVVALLAGAVAPVQCTRATVPDEAPAIEAAVRGACDGGAFDLVLTTGGTGFAARDVTPEAVGPLLSRTAPGVVHAMQAHSLTRTPLAWLSRPVAGVRGTTVVVTLPGSPTAAVECLEPLLLRGGLRHAVELARGDGTDPHPAAAAAGATAAARRPDVASRPRQSTFQLLPMAAALALVAEHTPVAAVIAEVATDAPTTAGLVLARDVVSSFPHPPFRASTKDGYAVVAGNWTGECRVVGALRAGAAPSPGASVAGGREAVRVNTGGPLPEGADAVVQVEDTRLLERTTGGEEAVISVATAPVAGRDIRPAGSDLREGGVAVEAGSVLGSPEVGLAVSVGAATVAVFRRPRVAVLSTGDELQAVPAGHGAVGLPPAAGKVYDSNRAMLAAEAARHSDGAVFDAGIAADTMGDTRAKLQLAFENSDVIVSSGGVSMGEADCVKAVLDEMGATTHFGRVNMKPGKPTAFATLGRKLFFALPGNPVSAMVCFHVFVVPALRQWRGLPPRLPTVQAAVAHAVALDPERPEYHRCRLVFRHGGSGGGFVAESTGLQASHRLLSLAGANGLMVLPAASADTSALAAGAVVPVVVIGPLLHDGA